MASRLAGAKHDQENRPAARKSQCPPQTFNSDSGAADFRDVGTLTFLDLCRSFGGVCMIQIKHLQIGKYIQDSC